MVTSTKRPQAGAHPAVGEEGDPPPGGDGAAHQPPAGGRHRGARGPQRDRRGHLPQVHGHPALLPGERAGVLPAGRDREPGAQDLRAGAGVRAVQADAAGQFEGGAAAETWRRGEPPAADPAGRRVLLDGESARPDLPEGRGELRGAGPQTAAGHVSHETLHARGLWTTEGVPGEGEMWRKERARDTLLTVVEKKTPLDMLLVFKACIDRYWRCGIHEAAIDNWGMVVVWGRKWKRRRHPS
ncbi:hypothetical protein ON010_g18545 [Phytophthora cinnamomi]|nr:hypothetical protein ON010_g18545 [Phytophthora cinnamomi]